MRMIPTTLLIIAGLIAILLLVRAFKVPSEEKKRAQLAKLNARNEQDSKLLRDVMHKASQPTGRKD